MAKREHIPAKLRHEVFQRDNYRCRECGATNKETTLEIDHIVPVSKGGTNNINNLQTLCKKCNRSKYTRTWVGGVKDNNTPRISSNRYYNHSSKKSSKSYYFPKKHCPNCRMPINAHDNICPSCSWDLKMGRYHNPIFDGVPKKTNINSSKEKLLEDNIDELCRIYSIPKLGKKYVINKIMEEHSYDDVVDKLKLYESNEQKERRNKDNCSKKFYNQLDDFSVICLCHYYGVNNKKKLIKLLVDESETIESVQNIIDSNYNFKRITSENKLLKYHCNNGCSIYAKSLEELEEKVKMMRIIWDP